MHLELRFNSTSGFPMEGGWYFFSGGPSCVQSSETLLLLGLLTGSAISCSRRGRGLQHICGLPGLWFQVCLVATKQCNTMSIFTVGKAVAEVVAVLLHHRRTLQIQGRCVYAAGPQCCTTGLKSSCSRPPMLQQLICCFWCGWRSLTQTMLLAGT